MHSSFFGEGVPEGVPSVQLAGYFAVINGRVGNIDNNSGHYRPLASELEEGSVRLSQQGFLQNGTELIAREGSGQFFIDGIPSGTSTVEDALENFSSPAPITQVTQANEMVNEVAEVPQATTTRSFCGACDIL